MNDEARMSNDEGNSNNEAKNERHFRHSSFGFHHFQDASCSPRRGFMVAPTRACGSSISQLLVFTCGSLKMSHPRAQPCWLVAGRSSGICSIRISGAQCFSFPSMTRGEGALRRHHQSARSDRQVADLVTETPPAGLAEVPVFLGGPCREESTNVCGVRTGTRAEGSNSATTIGLRKQADALDQTKIITVCAFVGYAGWGAGQLESEMKQKAWLLQKANPSVLKLDRLPTYGSTSCAPGTVV